MKRRSRRRRMTMLLLSTMSFRWSELRRARVLRKIGKLARMI